MRVGTGFPTGVTAGARALGGSSALVFLLEAPLLVAGIDLDGKLLETGKVEVLIVDLGEIVLDATVDC